MSIDVAYVPLIFGAVFAVAVAIGIGAWVALRAEHKDD